MTFLRSETFMQFFLETVFQKIDRRESEDVKLKLDTLNMEVFKIKVSVYF